MCRCRTAADERDVILADSDVLEVRHLQECGDARPAELAALKAADLRLVVDRVGARQPVLLGAPALRVPLRGGQRRLEILGLVAGEPGVVGERALVLAVVRGVALVERHGVTLEPPCASLGLSHPAGGRHARRRRNRGSTTLRTYAPVRSPVIPPWWNSNKEWPGSAGSRGLAVRPQPTMYAGADGSRLVVASGQRDAVATTGPSAVPGARERRRWPGKHTSGAAASNENATRRAAAIGPPRLDTLAERPTGRARGRRAGPEAREAPPARRGANTVREISADVGAVGTRSGRYRARAAGGWRTRSSWVIGEVEVQAQVRFWGVSGRAGWRKLTGQRARPAVRGCASRTRAGRQVSTRLRPPSVAAMALERCRLNRESTPARMPPTSGGFRSQTPITRPQTRQP